MYGLAALAVVGIALVVAGALLANPVMTASGVCDTVVGLVLVGLMVYSSKIGKTRVRDRLLDDLSLRGDEDVLDLGCGSGLMLLGAAQRLTTGTATSVDLWRRRDQSGSNREQCLANARRLGVQDRVELIDGDMTRLPMPDASFDLVVASLAIHNLHPMRRREQAVREALRVLRSSASLPASLSQQLPTATVPPTTTRARRRRQPRAPVTRQPVPKMLPTQKQTRRPRARPNCARDRTRGQGRTTRAIRLRRTALPRHQNQVAPRTCPPPLRKQNSQFGSMAMAPNPPCRGGSVPIRS